MASIAPPELPVFVETDDDDYVPEYDYDSDYDFDDYALGQAQDPRSDTNIARYAMCEKWVH